MAFSLSPTCLNFTIALACGCRTLGITYLHLGASHRVFGICTETKVLMGLWLSAPSYIRSGPVSRRIANNADRPQEHQEVGRLPPED